MSIHVREVKDICTRNSHKLKQELTGRILRKDEELEDCLITIDMDMKQGQTIENKKEIKKMKQETLL